MEITKQEAKRIYPDAPEWLKEKLEQEFGADYFQPESHEEIKTFEDACSKLDIDPLSVSNESDTPDEAAYKKLKVIVKAINAGWEPDWNNTDQRKYWPWFRLSSGFGFSYSLYGCAYTRTLVGSRLCFESEEKCTYAANQFIDIYEQFLTIKK
jgi:hypothetical protein